MGEHSNIAADKVDQYPKHPHEPGLQVPCRVHRMGCTEAGELRGETNTNIFSVKMTYDHWAAASARLRQSLLIPLNENGGGTVVKIVEDGHKTVIRMSSAGSLADTNPNFKTLQECLEWVQTRTVSH